MAGVNNPSWVSRDTYIQAKADEEYWTDFGKPLGMLPVRWRGREEAYFNVVASRSESSHELHVFAKSVLFDMLAAVRCDLARLEVQDRRGGVAGTYADAVAASQ